jgi:hypothetical protein
MNLLHQAESERTHLEAEGENTVLHDVVIDKIRVELDEASDELP